MINKYFFVDINVYFAAVLIFSLIRPSPPPVISESASETQVFYDTFLLFTVTLACIPTMSYLISLIEHGSFIENPDMKC